jgi:hypothetical protein
VCPFRRSALPGILHHTRSSNRCFASLEGSRYRCVVLRLEWPNMSWTRGASRLASVAVLLAGCASMNDPFQLSAPAQHLLGRPEAQVLACMGAPTQKQVVDPPSVTPNSGKSIWTYEYAEGSQSCSMRLVFRGGYVSQVTSADATGAPLAQPDLCLPANLAWCANTAPPPPPTPPANSKLR